MWAQWIHHGQLWASEFTMTHSPKCLFRIDIDCVMKMIISVMGP